MEEKSDFKEKVEMEIKRTKKALYLEELGSALIATAFGINIAAIFTSSFGFFMILNFVIIYFCLKQFKPTIKRQETFHKYLTFLKEALKDKNVWTSNQS